MTKRVVSILMALGILLMVCGAAGAATRVDTAKPVSLTLEYGHDGQPFVGQSIRLFRVADLSEYVEFTLTGAFADLPVDVNHVKTQEEWHQIASTLEAFVVSGQIAPDAQTITDDDGVASFPALAQGLYLVQGIRVDAEGGYWQFDSFMLTLPDLNDSDQWVYDLAAKPKSSFHEVKLEEINYSISKLWKDEGNENARPQSIQIELYKDGVLQETVTLSAENHWNYAWTAVDDGSVWHAVEINVPDGYTVTLEQDGNHFTAINSAGPPKTGDSFNLSLVFLLMCICGAGLIALGVLGATKRRV